MIKKSTHAPQSMSQPQFPSSFISIQTTLHLSRIQQQLFIHFNLYIGHHLGRNNKRQYSRDDFDEWRRQGYILIQNLFFTIEIRTKQCQHASNMEISLRYSSKKCMCARCV